MGITVKDVHSLHGVASLSVSESTSLKDVIEKFAREPGLHGIFLVDENQRFAGILSRLALLKWAQFQLFDNKQDAAVTASVDNVPARSLARGDWKTFGVTESDSMEKAFNQMISYQVDIIPVLNEKGHIIGDLRLSEILLKVIQTEPR